MAWGLFLLVLPWTCRHGGFKDQVKVWIRISKEPVVEIGRKVLFEILRCSEECETLRLDRRVLEA
jgi:hypothetical protein